VGARDDLSPGEWAVLALVAEQPAHGWAVARTLSPDGEVGRVWTIPRPLVYRALDTLLAADLLAHHGVEAGDRGPRRVILEVTPAGRARLDAWLAEPVARVRDVRSLLLLKLLFLDRRGADPRPLLTQQRTVLATTEERLAARLAESSGAERMLLAFRLETTRAVGRFVEGQLAAPPPGR
jgi:DNA-binding PadR family transcriptional regulator